MWRRLCGPAAHRKSVEKHICKSSKIRWKLQSWSWRRLSFKENESEIKRNQLFMPGQVDESLKSLKGIAEKSERKLSSVES